MRMHFVHLTAEVDDKVHGFRYFDRILFLENKTYVVTRGTVFAHHTMVHGVSYIAVYLTGKGNRPLDASVLTINH